MKTVKAGSMKSWEYNAEREQIKKQTRQMRDQRRNRKGQWTNIVGYD